MTEAPDVYPDSPDDDDQDPGAAGADSVEGGLREPALEELRTGDSRVDAVLDSLHGLDERPVGEHAAVFERAHENLRAALDPHAESA
jgi:hypothetical protein